MVEALLVRPRLVHLLDHEGPQLLRENPGLLDLQSADMVAQEDAVDLIVLGTHGKGMLDQALFGSTMERVLRKAPCPVLTCRLVERDFV